MGIECDSHSDRGRPKCNWCGIISARPDASTSVAQDGDAALIAARNGRPDLIVLDLGLPKRDGLDVIREIRTFARMPIVILTARGEETDRIVGLELGADDYIVKPFSRVRWSRRCGAVLRRTSARG
ncbi:MAG: response regulator [Thermomicrobiales bacterium]